MSINNRFILRALSKEILNNEKIPALYLYTQNIVTKAE